jgi:hypothetical protein
MIDKRNKNIYILHKNNENRVVEGLSSLDLISGEERNGKGQGHPHRSAPQGVLQQEEY